MAMSETKIPIKLDDLKNSPFRRDVTVWRELMESADEKRIDDLLRSAGQVFLDDQIVSKDEHTALQEGNCLQEIAMQLARFPGKGLDILKRCLSHENFRTRVFARQTCLDWPEAYLDAELKTKMGMN
jgi:hypothetical protein